MAFCTECGANVPDEKRFCTECGKPMREASQPIPDTYNAPAAPPPPAAPPRQAPPAPPAYPAPPVPSAYPAPPAYPAVAAPPPKGTPYAVMGTGGFIGFTLLFNIPVVGWLICLIMAFAPGNRNRRNYARAMLVFLIVGLILAFVVYTVVGWIWEAVIEYITVATDGIFTGFDGFDNIFDILN